ncbi:MAG: hypothetical protein PHO00_05285 [bacterium]|nr:hypothetical protein [bacterium]
MRKFAIFLFLSITAIQLYVPAGAREKDETIKAISSWIYEYKGSQLIVSFFKPEDMYELEHKWERITKKDVTIALVYINNLNGKKDVIFDTQYGGVKVSTFGKAVFEAYDARKTAGWILGDEFLFDFSAVKVPPGNTDKRLVMFYGTFDPMDIESVGICMGGSSTWGLKSKKTKKYKPMSYTNPKDLE